MRDRNENRMNGQSEWEKSAAWAYDPTRTEPTEPPRDRNKTRPNEVPERKKARSGADDPKRACAKSGTGADDPSRRAVRVREAKHRGRRPKSTGRPSARR